MDHEKSTYLTILKPSVGEIYKDKSSKFIGYAFPVTTEDEIKKHLEEVKKEHAKARHWCYAWQLGIDKITYRANDDGEPSNSAGKPIYGQILSHKITNVFIVVVRYYGGTKLGVGGLISANKTAANSAITNANIVKKIVRKEINISFEYKDINTVMRLINKFDVEILNKKMELSCEYQLAVSKTDFENFKSQLITLHEIKNDLKPKLDK